MVLTNDEDLRARARATELVGIVAMSVGRSRMEPILPPFIEAAISVIKTITLFLCFGLLVFPRHLISGVYPYRVLGWNSVSFENTHMGFSAMLQRFWMMVSLRYC